MCNFDEHSECGLGNGPIDVEFVMGNLPTGGSFIVPYDRAINAQVTVGIEFRWTGNAATPNTALTTYRRLFDPTTHQPIFTEPVDTVLAAQVASAAGFASGDRTYASGMMGTRIVNNLGITLLNVVIRLHITPLPTKGFKA